MSVERLARENSYLFHRMAIKRVFKALLGEIIPFICPAGGIAVSCRNDCASQRQRYQIGGKVGVY